MKPGNLLADTPRAFADPETGARCVQVTRDASINHAFFFLNPSFRPGSETELGLVTHRTGSPQLCHADLAAGTLRLLTEVTGLNAFSPAWSKDGRCLYFTTKTGAIGRVKLATLAVETLVELPGAGLGEAGMNADETSLVTACKRGDTHGVYVLDLRTGQGRVIVESRMKIIHPQFHPTNPELIVYAGDPAPRLWAVNRDGSENRNLYADTEKEFFVHESFLGDSEDLIFCIWPYRLCRLNLHERRVHTIADLNAWHMASSRDGSRIVTDTNHPDRGLLLVDPATGDYRTLCQPRSSCGGSQWRTDHPAGPEVWAAIRGAEGQALSWMEMQVDTVYGPQWTHPHPAFSDSGRRVVYQSDATGTAQVYVVDVPGA